MQQQHTGVFSGPQKPLPRECSNTLNCAKDCFMGSWSWGNLPGYGSTTDWLKSNPPPTKPLKGELRMNLVLLSQVNSDMQRQALHVRRP